MTSKRMYGKPDHGSMQKIAAILEKRGTTWQEWEVIFRLFNEGGPCADYVLAYANDLMALWNKEKSTAATGADECAFLAALLAADRAHEKGIRTKAMLREWDNARLQPPCNQGAGNDAAGRSEASGVIIPFPCR